MAGMNKEAAIREGNAILHRLANQWFPDMRVKVTFTRRLLFSKTCPSGVTKETWENVKSSITDEEFDKVNTVRLIQDELIDSQEVKELCHSLSWSAYCKHSRITYAEYHQEAIIAVSQAVWKYSKDSSLMGFFSVCIKRHLKKYRKLYLRNLGKFGTLEADLNFVVENRSVTNNLPSDVFKGVNLTKFEEEVFLAHMENESMAAVARKWNVSKMTASNSLKKAQEKLKTIYN